jgi:hypothetical protein
VTSFAKRALAICLLTAVVESVLLLMIAEALLLFFVLGPIAFLAILVGRRKVHAERTRRLAGLSMGIGAFGIAAMAVACFQQLPPDRASVAPLVVPVVQWLAILYVWISISRQESREKREKMPPST